MTEHMPTESISHLAVEEAKAGLDIASVQRRFEQYFREARRLADLHKDRIDILVGFETEVYSGYENEVARLIARYDPDLIVGSVHHVHDVLFDSTARNYQRAVELSGGIEALYCDYFDAQFELIETFRPAVVGHFDLIRIHDSDYLERWEVPEIRDRALRNLERIKALGLILDFNVRALAKGAAEPYVSAPWLKIAIQEGIAIVPGDDSHGVASVGNFIDDGISQLVAKGGSTNWKKPEIGRQGPSDMS
ncbi:MAG: histidinol-phosphatase HisJ family protein [Alphaproteobacteria bacterium]|nr:histidinol-phosphatase HisJ family protein [Alphaproteobacteria bacterium]